MDWYIALQIIGIGGSIGMALFLVACGNVAARVWVEEYWRQRNAEHPFALVRCPVCRGRFYIGHMQ